MLNSVESVTLAKKLQAENGLYFVCACVTDINSVFAWSLVFAQ
jgi:hypothetical protein